MRVVLSSIGPGPYKEVEYCWAPPGEQPTAYRTALFPLAVDHFFRPERLLLAATPKACAGDACRKIEEAVGDRLILVKIPEGKTEKELWDVFEILSKAVPPDAEVILDVTHGFRSLPLLFYGVLTYLGRSSGVHLERIVYGAYDAGETGPDGVTRAPVFDITVLADLQEWLHAVDAFIDRSDAKRLVELLERAHRRPWLARESEDSAVPHKLQNMAGCLREFSRSLRLMRALDALQQAAKARTLARQVEQEAAVWAKPFSHILASVAAEIDSLAMDKPSDLGVEALRRQLALVKHYVAKDLIVQAVLLGREWLVNWLAWRSGETSWLDLQGRRRLECALSRAARGLRGQAEPEDETEKTEKCAPEPPDWYKAVPEAQEAAELWDDLASARNDVAHCGMNRRPKSARALSETTDRLLGRLERLLDKRTSSVAQ